MNITHKAYIISALYVLAVVVSIAAIVFYRGQVIRLNEKVADAEKVNQEIVKLSIISADFYQNRSERVIAQWRAQYASLSSFFARRLDDRARYDENETSIINKMSIGYENIGSLFLELEVSEFGEDQLTKLSEQLSITTLSLTEEAFALTEYERLRISLLQKQLLTVLIISLALIFAITIITTPLIILTIAKPITALTDVTSVIAKGEFNVKISDRILRSNSELGALAQSFERMSKKLRGFYADLERKVEERTVQLKHAKDQADKQLEETEEMNKIMVGRELKMVELKKEVERLRSKEGGNSE